MRDQQIKQALQGIAEQKVPPDLDLWPALKAELAHSQTVATTFNWHLAWRPATRLGWSGLTLLVLLFFGTVAYAFSPAIRSLLHLDPSLEEVSSAGLGQPLDLSETIDGVTAALNWAYADENRVVIAYTIQDSSQQQYEPRQFTLSDSAGTVFSSTVGMGTIGASDILRTALPPGEGQYVFSFDASPVSGIPSTLDLHLQFTLASSEEAVVGPFSFDFTVPYYYGRVAEPKQIVTTDSISVTLEKVVLTPSEFTAVICFAEPEEGFNTWLPISQVEVQAEGASSKAKASTQRHLNDPNCTINSYFPSLYKYTGSWTLTVTELVGFKEPAVDGNPPEQLRIQGPWTFQFELP